MGIIVSGFRGCGCGQLAYDHGDDIKIMDARNLPSDSVVDVVMKEVDNYDIVFIASDNSTRRAFTSARVDFDVFYPSKGRRSEFTLNEVKKHTKHDIIRDLDVNFFKMVDEIEDDDSEYCHKHLLSEEGQFIGNSEVIVKYIDSVKKSRKQANETTEEPTND